MCSILQCNSSKQKRLFCNWLYSIERVQQKCYIQFSMFPSSLANKGNDNVLSSLEWFWIIEYNKLPSYYRREWTIVSHLCHVCWLIIYHTIAITASPSAKKKNRDLCCGWTIYEFHGIKSGMIKWMINSLITKLSDPFNDRCGWYMYALLLVTKNWETQISN